MFSVSEDDQSAEISSSSSASSSPKDTENKKDKLVHLSFRLKHSTFKALEKEAQKRGVTLSSLVNKTLENYVTSEMYFEELGFILVSKDFLRKTIGSLDDEKFIEKLGREMGLTVAKEYVSYFFPELNGESMLKFLDLWLRRFQSYQHKFNNDNYTSSRHYFTVNHDINMNFSIALKSMLEGLIEPIIKRSIDFRDITPNAITFSLEVHS